MLLVEQFKALGDLNRLRILRVLGTGPFNVQELTKALKSTQSNLSHHLKVLQQAGLVRSQRQGTWSYYQISEDEEMANFVARNLVTASPSELPEVFLKDQEEIEGIASERRDRARHFFDSVADNWNTLREEGISPDQYLSRLKELIPDNKTLLELGCGAGHLLAALTPRKGKTLGVDNSTRMLDQARAALGKEIDLRLGELEHLPLADESVEIALSHMVLHHISNPLDALKDAARVLKRHGYLIIVDLLKHDNEIMRERLGDLWLGFDLRQIKSWISEAGFGDTKVERQSGELEGFILTARKK